MIQLPLPPPIATWHDLVPVSERQQFLDGEKVYCAETQIAFRAATDDNREELREAALARREEYLLQYHELHYGMG